MTSLPTPTRFSVREWCRDLADKRRHLAKVKTAEAALAVQRSKNTMNAEAKRLRASFTVLTNQALLRT